MMKTTKTVKINEKQYQKMAKIREKHGTPVALFVRRAIEKELEKYKDVWEENQS